MQNGYLSSTTRRPLDARSAAVKIDWDEDAGCGPTAATTAGCSSTSTGREPRGIVAAGDYEAIRATS